jgi:hypothetical protein
MGTQEAQAHSQHPRDDREPAEGVAAHARPEDRQPIGARRRWRRQGVEPCQELQGSRRCGGLHAPAVVQGDDARGHVSNDQRGLHLSSLLLRRGAGGSRDIARFWKPDFGNRTWNNRMDLRRLRSAASSRRERKDHPPSCAGDARRKSPCLKMLASSGSLAGEQSLPPIRVLMFQGFAGCASCATAGHKRS